MSLTIEQRAEMRRVAEAATPGPWTVGLQRKHGIYSPKSSAPIATVRHLEHSLEAIDQEAEANGVHIAAFNPAAAISLLDQLAVREREVAELREALSRHLSPTACDYRGGTHCITHGDARPCRHEVTRGLLEGGR